MSKYTPGYPKFIRSASPPADYVPLTPEQVRHKISLMNQWIKLLPPNWKQGDLERHERLFTTCARQSVEPNWDKLLNLDKKPEKVVREARIEAPKPSPILVTHDGTLRMEPLWPSDHNYNAWYNGEKIAEGEYSPILASCRVLLDRGITGLLKVYGPNDDFRATVDIQWGASHRVTIDRVGHTVFALFKVQQEARTELSEDV